MLKQKGRFCIPNVYTYPVGITTERFGSSTLLGPGADDDEHTTRNGNYGDGDEIHLEDLRRRILTTQRQQSELRDRPDVVYIIVYNPILTIEAVI